MGITPSAQKKESDQQVVPLLKNPETRLENPHPGAAQIPCPDSQAFRTMATYCLSLTLM